MTNTRPQITPILTILWLCLGMAFSAQGADFVVAPGGSDKNPGTEAKPFATLARARDAVRALKKDGMTKDVVVNIHAGEYLLDAPVVFGPGDSGSDGFRVIYQNADAIGSARFVGGKPVPGWERHEGKIWKKTGVKHIVTTLYEDGQRGHMARTPNQGNDSKYPNAMAPYFVTVGGNVKTMVYAEGALDPTDWKLTDRAAVNWWGWGGKRDWGQRVVQLESVDAATRTLHVKQRNKTNNRVSRGDRGFVLNVYALLDAPGEFYQDVEQETLYYIPRGDDPNEADMRLPKPTVLVELAGTDAEAPVHSIIFSGLSFEYTNCYILLHPDSMWEPLESCAALFMRYANGIHVEKCRFGNIGDFAVFARDGIHHCTISNCRIEHVGRGGIVITNQHIQRSEHPNLRAEHNLIYNCLIHDLGETFAGAIYNSGVQLHTVSDCRVAHCDIARNIRYGISLRGHYTTQANHSSKRDMGTHFARNNVFEYIKIAQVGSDSGDMGAVHGAHLNEPDGSNINTFRQIIVRDIYAHSSMKDYAPNGIFVDHPRSCQKQIFEDIDIAHTRGRAWRDNHNPVQTFINVSWKPGFDRSHMETERIGLTPEFPKEYGGQGLTGQSSDAQDWETRTRSILEKMARDLEQTLKPWPVPNRTFPVEEYGAKGDGVALNTTAIQAAIDACSASGGGVVLFGQGNYVTGTIDLKSGVMLEINEGSRILGSTDLADYPERVAKRKTVMDTHMDIRHSLIFAEGVERVGLRGPGGIDFRGTKKNFPGDGRPSWGKLPGRPFGMRFIDCRHIVVKDITLKDSPSWMQDYLNCENLILEKVSVVNHTNHNQDGFDLDGCRRAIVRDCFVNARDDAMCLKGAGLGANEDILIEDSTFYSKTNPLKIGTDTQGDFRRILARNLVLGGTPKGMPDLHPGKTTNSGITLATVDGGDVEDILITDVTINEVDCPIFISVDDRGRVMPGMPHPPIGTLRRVIIENIKGKNSGKQGSFISGIKDGLVEDVVIRNVDLEMSGGVQTPPTDVLESPKQKYPDADHYEDPLPAYAFYIRHARNIEFHDIQVRPVSPDARPLFSTGGNTEGLYLNVPPITGETIIQTVNSARNDHWNLAIWGSPVAAPTAGKGYQSVSGLVLRTPETGSTVSTFAGGSLELAEGSGLLLKNVGTTSTVRGAFMLNGGHLYHGPSGEGGDATFAINSFTTSGDSDISISRGDLMIDAFLTGNGDLHLSNNGGADTLKLSFSGIHSFTGSITIGGVGSGYINSWGRFANGLTLDLGASNYTFQDRVTILGDSVLHVNSGQTLTFAPGDLVDPVHGAVAAGTYTTADLGANYSGDGTIEVGTSPGGTSADRRQE